MQQFDRTERRRRGKHGTELESVEEHRAKAMQHGPGARRKGGQVDLIRSG
jgi:hypothetical protein